MRSGPHTRPTRRPIARPTQTSGMPSGEATAFGRFSASRSRALSAASTSVWVVQKWARSRVPVARESRKRAMASSRSMAATRVSMTR